MNPLIVRRSTKDKHELYAQLRVKLVVPRVACAEVGLNPINAYRTENLPKVQRRIRELRERDGLDISRQRRILRDELTRVALLRLPDLFVEVEIKNVKGEVLSIKRELRPISEWTDDERAAVAELWTDKDGIDRVRPHSKLTAIDLLMKLDGLVDPDIIAVQVNNSTQVNNGGARSRIASRVEAIASRAHRDPAGAGT